MLNTDNVFPDRKELVKRKSYRDSIIESAKSIDIEKIDYSKVDFNPQNKIVEQQKVYFWIRIYLKEEIEIKPDTDITITYLPTEEFIQAKFICFAKKGLDKNGNSEVVDYNPEDDKKVLCLMIDSERIDKNSDDIPFLRSLFRISRWYEAQILRHAELKIEDSTGRILDFYDIDL